MLTALFVQEFNCSSMVYFDETDGWIAYLTNYAIDMCLRRCIDHCTGCIDCKAAPIYHKHIQLGLHEKIACYLDSVRSTVIAEIDHLYLSYSYRLTQTPANPNLIEFGVNFLKTSTPSDLYYGAYKPSFNETYLELIYRYYFWQTNEVVNNQPLQQPQQPNTPVKKSRKPKCPRKQPVKKVKKEPATKVQVHLEKLSQLEDNM